MNHRLFIVLSIMCTAVLSAHAQSVYLHHYSATEEVSPLPPSNSISHIVAANGVLWIGTSHGLARSTDGGRTWDSFGANAAFARPGIFAVALRGDTIWSSTGYSKDVEGQSVQTGAGFTYSVNGGTTWASLPQPMDARNDSIVQYGANRINFLPIVVPEQDVTFDIALSRGTVWSAGWSSGLRKSTDNGLTWQRIALPNQGLNAISPADSLGTYFVDPRTDNNYLLFSVFAESDSVIWAGSAGGINKSTDGGISWQKFTASNQVEHILADWVIAIAGQPLGGHMRIWATNWPASGNEQRYAVVTTDNGGIHWSPVLKDVKAYAFAFKDSVAYVACDNGLYRTADDGKSWVTAGPIVDPTTGARITSSTFFSVAVLGDTVYAGTSDGLASTVDNGAHPFGSEWHIMRTYATLAQTGSAYAYPNPFSPGSESVRIHYRLDADAAVSVELFDFGMNRVRTVIHSAPRSGGRELDEIWDGRDDGGNTVPNGVYFYRLTIGTQDPVWGKVMVLR